MEAVSLCILGLQALQLQLATTQKVTGLGSRTDKIVSLSFSQLARSENVQMPKNILMFEL